MLVTRFELATFWSVARRSIQLSYTNTTQVFYKKELCLSTINFRNFGEAKRDQGFPGRLFLQ